MKHKPGLNLNDADKAAEFAGKQYQLAQERPECRSKFYNVIRDELLKLMFSRFKYYGPTEQEAHAIEYQLITNGRVGIVKSIFDIEREQPNGVFIGPASTDNVEIDFYGNPVSCFITGKNGKKIYADDANNFVIGFDTNAKNINSTLTLPLISYIENATYMIDNALQMWMVAAETRKDGKVFTVANQRVKTFIQNVLNKISMNNPYIVVQGSIQGTGDGAIFAPSNTEALRDYHDNFINCVSFWLDFLGLENQPQNKQERLVVTEAMNNRNLSRYIGADALLARKKMCDELRKKGIADWDVEFYLDSVSVESMNDANIEGDADNDIQ